MSKLMRQVHRWLSIAFTLCVVANFVNMGINGADQKPGIITYSPLLPLFLMFVTGVYLFALPYLNKARTSSSSSS